MRTGNSQRFEQWNDDYDMDNIIYLEDHRNLDDYRETLRRRNLGKGDVFWNVAFVVLCLSVLICLFLH